MINFLKVVFFILVAATFAQAQTAETQYINVSCANNGDGTANTCAGAPAGAGAYNSLSNWESQDRDLVAENVVLTVELTGGTETVPGFNSITTLDGWTTDATRNITLQGINYTIQNDMSSGALISIRDPYYTLLNINTNNIRTSPGQSTPAGIEIFRVPGTVIDGGIHSYSGTDSGGGCAADSGCAAIRLTDSELQDGTTTVVANTLAFEGYNVGFELDNQGGSRNGKLVLYNNTWVNMAQYGYMNDHDGTGNITIEFKNNLISGSGTADYFNNAASDDTTTYATNFSSDASLPASGGNDLSNTFTFTNAAGEDYTLASGDTSGAIEGGTDLSADTHYAFNADLAGISRPRGTLWDAGAYENSPPLTTTTYYVDPTCGVNGDGSSPTCSGDGPGGAGAFDNLASAIDLDLDITAATGTNENVTIEVAAGVETLASNTTVDLDLWTTSPSNALTINFADGYRLEAPNTVVAIFQVDVGNVTVNGGHFRLTGSSASEAQAIVTRGGDNIVFDGLTIDWPAATTGCGTDDKCAGFYAWEGYGDNVSIINSTIQGAYRNGIRFSQVGNSAYEYAIYNNTVFGVERYGIYTSNIYARTATYNIANNIVTGSGVADYANANTGDHTVVFRSNFISDTSMPDVSGADGDTTFTVTSAPDESNTFVFVDAVNNDFTLDAADTSGAEDGGTDLSADGFYAFSVDKEDTVRDAPWSAGAVEYVPSSTTFNDLTQCPGGASPRADIEECLQFDDVASCNPDELNDACWTANNSDGEVTSPWTSGAEIQDHPELFGDGSLHIYPEWGSTGQFSSWDWAATEEKRLRFYFLYDDHYMNYSEGDGPHGFNISAGGDCGRSLTMEYSSYGWKTYGFRRDSSGTHTCDWETAYAGASDDFLGPTTIPFEFKNGQRYEIEFAFKVDTSCSSGLDDACNGWFKVWIDGTLLVNLENVNWGNVDSIANGSSNPQVRFTGGNFFRMYYHAGGPPWDGGYWLDNIVLGNDADLAIGTTTMALPATTGVTNSPFFMSEGAPEAIVQDAGAAGDNDSCYPRGDCTCKGLFFYKLTSEYPNPDSAYQNFVTFDTTTSLDAGEWFDEFGESIYCPGGTNDYTGNEVNGSIQINLAGASGDNHAFQHVTGGRPAAEVGVKPIFVSGAWKMPHSNNYTSLPCLSGLGTYRNISGSPEVGPDARRNFTCFTVDETDHTIAVMQHYWDNAFDASPEFDAIIYDTGVPLTDNGWQTFELGISADGTTAWAHIDGVQYGGNIALTHPMNNSGGTNFAPDGIIFGVRQYESSEAFVANYDLGRMTTASMESTTLGWGSDCGDSGSSPCGPSEGINTASLVGGAPSETITIAATTAAASEPSTDGEFTITLSTAAPVGGVTIGLSKSGSGTELFDYNLLPNSVTITQGNTTAVIPVVIIDDNDAENTESVTLTLSSSSNPSFAVSAPLTATVNITDDDGSSASWFGYVIRNVEDAFGF